MITVTESAVRKVRRLMNDDPAAGDRLRIGVRGGGCSGFSYFMEITGAQSDDDLTYEHHGLRVVVDPKSHTVLDGTELDFVEGLQHHGFRWRNPNEKSNCGCGLSFDI